MVQKVDLCRANANIINFRQHTHPLFQHVW